MSSFVAKLYVIFYLVFSIGSISVFGDDHASTNSHRGIKLCSKYDKRHIHLGTYDGLDRKPLVITVRKSDLKEPMYYAVTADCERATGNDWMSIGVLNEEEHKEVKGHHQKYYQKILTKKFMRVITMTGRRAHGINAQPFISRNVRKPQDVNCRGGNQDNNDAEYTFPPPEGPEYAKGAIIIYPGAMEGKYYVDFAYGNPYEGPKMVCFKEVIVKVLP
ncbi:hypothetical protein BBBOND_0110730 [Babesia bigemina]|uniref:Uncharacterized protein n=1 Tax=Babesia bigemina TaxID=5866 RepID=A0A061D1Y0_BABBI|nr:hypothetical protein BBBOND_0110730 [Babesia bigemina]CDR94776.1 hypothetical protein BBBOND_0110730 [Babesia bigemina]|eukprot:XP_012766962.1 hypothetical protein BBBOND_0110730 [Babesia bigemina]